MTIEEILFDGHKGRTPFLHPDDKLVKTYYSKEVVKNFWDEDTLRKIRRQSSNLGLCSKYQKVVRSTEF